MSQIPSTGAGGLSGVPQDDLSSGLGSLDVDHFFQLMIAELQNQDPLDPLDNAQMMQQISQIRAVAATDQLTDTLDAVLLGQNVSNATSLIGKEIRALTDEGDKVEGVVDRVSISDNKTRVHVGTQTVRLTNVSEIRPVAIE